MFYNTYKDTKYKDVGLPKGWLQMVIAHSTSDVTDTITVPMALCLRDMTRYWSKISLAHVHLAPS